MLILTRMAVAGAALLAMAAPRLAAAQTSYGTVTVCYFSAECTYISAAGLKKVVGHSEGAEDHPMRSPTGANVLDGPAFLFTNTSDVAIKDATFAIVANKKLGITGDSFKIGTIKPGGTFLLVVGGTNDGKTRTTSDFFYYYGVGQVLDTSDTSINADATTFVFKGKVGATKVSTGDIVAGTTAGPSKDGSVAHINFLGGPGNADGPCNDCVAPMVIGQITAQ